MKSENKIPLTKGEKFILIVYGIMAFCSLLMLFRSPCQHDDVQLNFEKAQSEILLENAKREKSNFEMRVAQLEKSNTVLKKLLSQADIELDKADSRNYFLRGKIRQFSDTIQADTSLNKTSACDSLRVYSLEFAKSSTVRDSICDQEIFLLEKIAENRDSAYFTCERSLYAIDSNFQLLAKRHSELADQLFQTQKNLRQAKRNTRIWTGATLLLSGVTITLWMKHQ